MWRETVRSVVVTSVGPAYIMGEGKIAMTVFSGSSTFSSKMAACCFMRTGSGTSSSLVHPPEQRWRKTSSLSCHQLDHGQNLYALRGLSFLSQKWSHMKTDYRSLYDRKHWTQSAAKLSPLTLSLGLFLFYIPQAELRGSSSSGSWVVCTCSHMCFILCSVSSCSGKYILSIHCIIAAQYTGKMLPIMLPVTFFYFFIMLLPRVKPWLAAC